MTIETIKVFYPRVGKISAGYMAAKQTDDRIVTFPARAETLVFSSDDHDRLELMAKRLGGTVTPSPDPEVEAHWRLMSNATQIEVILPSDGERGWDVWFEHWGESGCLRRCDGKTCLFSIDPHSGERQDNIKCLCAALDLEGEDACKPSRLNVVIPSLLDIPGVGVWQIQSRGRATYAEIEGTLSLLRQLGGIAGVPLVLRIIIRQRRDRGGARRTFPVLTLSICDSFEQARKRVQEFRSTVHPEALPEPDREARPLGAGLSVEQEAAAQEHDRVLAPQAGPAPQSPSVPDPAPSPTEFWRAVRAAAARCGEEAQAYVRSRSSRWTDLRKVAPDVAVRVYRVALAAIEGDGAPIASGGTEPFRPAAKVRGTPTRDYTEFWTVVNEAARIEGDPTGAGWLARLASGIADPRQLDDATFAGLLAVARRVASGEARTKDPKPESATQTQAKDAGETPQDAAAKGPTAQPVTRDQIREIQRIWRERKVHPNTQCEQIRQITGNHMILARMTEPQAEQLLAKLRQETAAAS